MVTSFLVKRCFIRAILLVDANANKAHSLTFVVMLNEN